MIAWPAKDPADVADFTWTPALDEADTIATFVAAVTSGTITIDSSAFTPALATTWLRGGADSELAMGTLTVTTAGGRTFQEGFVLPVFARATETLAIFRLKYPAFVAVDDGLISYRLYEALASVGEAWPEDARMNARTAWAAHRLAEAGTLSGAVPQGLTSFKSGTFSATVSDSLASLTGYDATVYGREFLQLRRAFFSGPIMAWVPPVADYA